MNKIYWTSSKSDLLKFIEEANDDGYVLCDIKVIYEIDGVINYMAILMDVSED